MGARAVIVGVLITAAVGGAGLAVSSGGGGCATSTVNVPDGPDPWGGCWPGPSNTGPSGTLTTYAGSCLLTTNDVTIDSKIINCDLDIRATGIVISNSEVYGQITHNEVDVDRGTSKTAVTVTDTYIDGGLVPQSSSDGRGLEDRNFTATRVEFVRGRSGAFCQYYCLIQDSYVHGQDDDESGVAHESGFRLGSGSGTNAQYMLHNTISCDATPIDPDAGCSADISGYGDFDTIRDNTIEKNLIVANPTKVAYCVYGGASASKPFPNATNVQYIDNVFQKGSSGKCGAFGAITDLAVGVRGNTFTGNTWDDATAFPTPDA